MRVATTQLQPGCLLLNDVIGKTNQPIIPKNTVLTEEHIEVLKAFLVKNVDVSKKLATGEPFYPKEKATNTIIKTKQDDKVDLSFYEHYLAVTDEFEKHYDSWRHSSSIDIPNIRQLVIPLIKRNEKLKDVIFKLQDHVTVENYFYHHSIAVGLLSAFLAKQMGYLEHEWIQIGLAGVLSDAGMARIDENILQKEGSLTAHEMKKVKNHSIYSYRLIEHSSLMTHAAKLGVLGHHERMDGSGYPLGLNGKTIHPYAQIIAVCDMYHAMTSERFYKEKKFPLRVLEDLNQEQFSRLNPEVVHTMMNSIAHLSIGSKVILSDQSTGEIIFIDDKQPTRPMIKLDRDEKIISLKDYPNLHFVSFLTE